MFWFFILKTDFTDALLISVAVLVVTCPCAAGLATPAVMVRAVNHLLKQGVLVKSGDALERLADVNYIAIDKTGTLTTAKFEVDDTMDKEALEIAASMAANSHHPLAKALQKACPAAPLAGVREYIGEGLLAPDGTRLGSASFTQAQISSLHETTQPRLFLSRSGKPLHKFSFRDHEKPDAKMFLTHLKQRLLNVVVLSGDKSEIVHDLASRLGIDNFKSQLTPESKLAFIKQKQNEGDVVLMLGDGLNDAPALSLADVSIAPATATDISQSSADLILIKSDLLPIIAALDTSKKACTLIKQNLIFAAIYNIVTVPIALAGGLTPLIAAVLMSSSSILVMLNAQRLKG